MALLCICLVLFQVFKVFSVGRVVLYTVFLVCSLPQTVIKTQAKNLVKNLAKKLVTGQKLVRQIERQLPEKHVEFFQKTSLMLFPKNRKVLVNPSVGGRHGRDFWGRAGAGEKSVTGTPFRNV